MANEIKNTKKRDSEAGLQTTALVAKLSNIIESCSFLNTTAERFFTFVEDVLYNMGPSDTDCTCLLSMHIWQTQ